MVGGDLPGWLPTLFRRAGATALTDRRGECVYAGCPHYRKCFIERAARASAGCRPRHRQPCAGDGQRRARPRGRRSAPTRIVFDEGHHLFDAADSTFAAALTGQEAIELRRWIVGPEGAVARPAARARGAAVPTSPAMTRQAARAIEAAVQAARRAARRRLAAAARRRRSRSARSRRCSRRCAAPSTPAPTRAGCRLRPRDRAGRARPGAGRGRGAGGRGARRAAPPAGRARPAARGGARGRARLARRRRRAPGSKARSAALGWRGQIARAPGSRCSRGSAGRPIPISSTGSRSIGSRAANMMSACTATGSIPTQPLAETVLEARARRARHLGDAARRRRLGRSPRRAPARCISTRRPPRFEAPSPFDYAAHSRSADRHRRQARRPRRAGRRLCPADRGGGRRHARPVHRDPAAARRSMPASPTGSRATACRSTPSMSIRSTPARWSTSSATIRTPRCSAPMRLRDGVDVPGHSLRLVVMEGVPWPRADRAPRRAARGRRRHRAMTTGSSARGWPRRSAG